MNETTDGLPEGWAEAPLLDLSSLVRGVTYKKGEETRAPQKGQIALLRANNIDGDLAFEDLVYVPESRVAPDQVLTLGDVVIAMSSGSKRVVGKAATLKEPWAGTFGAFCGVVRPRAEVDPEFFGLFFQSAQYRDYVSEVSAGVNINNLRRKHFEDISFPLPPFAEQRRIVAAAEALLVRTAAVTERLGSVPKTMRRFRQAVLAAACDGRLTADWRAANPGAEPASALLERVAAGRRERLGRKYREPARPSATDLTGLPEGWAWTTFNATCEDVTVGHVGPMVDEYLPEGIPFLRSQNVRPMRFDATGLRFISEAFHEKLRKSELHPGDIVVVRSGYVGVACVVPQSLGVANCADLVIARPSPALHPQFGALYMNAPSARSHIGDTKVGIAQSHFNVGSMKVMHVPLPPLEEQVEIARRADALLALADKVEARVAIAQRHAERTAQAVLAKAFRGELVPTEASLAATEGRDFESGADLLVRLQEAPAAAPKRRGRPNAMTLFE